MYKLLDRIDSPVDLKKLPQEQLPLLATELREMILETVSRTGGHLASSLGAVEIAIALHYVFDGTSDDIIWDVGHQAYPHKILTALSLLSSDQAPRTEDTPSFRWHPESESDRS